MRSLLSLVAGLALLTALTFGLPRAAWAQVSPPVFQTEARAVSAAERQASHRPERPATGTNWEVAPDIQIAPERAQAMAREALAAR